MPLRAALSAPPETIQDLVLAADERYWDACELAVRGRPFAAIYVAGFAAEMLLKTAGLRFDGALPADPVQPRLGPAKLFGQTHFGGVDRESYHSLLFWAHFVEHKRVLAGQPLAVPTTTAMHFHATRAHSFWWVSMRYRSSSCPPSATTLAEAGVWDLLEDVEWLMANHSLLWT